MKIHNIQSTIAQWLICNMDELIINQSEQIDDFEEDAELARNIFISRGWECTLQNENPAQPILIVSMPEHCKYILRNQNEFMRVYGSSRFWKNPNS